MNVKNYNICDITLDTALQQFQNSGDSFPEATIIAASQLGPLLREAGNNLKKILEPGYSPFLFRDIVISWRLRAPSATNCFKTHADRE